MLNDTKPYGSILDFRQQQNAVDEAIRLFSGKDQQQAKEIWLVDPAPTVINKLEAVISQLASFMQSQGLTYTPKDVPKLKGDAACCQFVNLFKEVQRLKAQLDQYTDLTQDNISSIEQLTPPDDLQAFRGVYLETAQRLKAPQDKSSPQVQQLDLELVLFNSTVIDYDYIMQLIANYTQKQPDQHKISRAQLIGLIASDAKFIDDRLDIEAYIDTLQVGDDLDYKAIREGYEAFKKQKSAREVVEIAKKHSLEPEALQTFVDGILRRMIFDIDGFDDLFAPFDLHWKERKQKQEALIGDLSPLLRKLSDGREISGLGAYEQ